MEQTLRSLDKYLSSEHLYSVNKHYGETKAGDLYIQYGKFFNLMHE